MSTASPSVPKPIELTRVLVGEGREEVLFFEALLSHLGVSGVQVEDCKGKSELGTYLKALNFRSGFSQVEKLSIVRDADGDPVAALQSVESGIQQAGFPQDLVVTKLILPGNNQPGALEHLCWHGIEGQPVAACVERFFDCAEQATGHKHTTLTTQAKARIHVWLATHKEPDLRLGYAAKKGFVDWNAPAFTELKAFLLVLA